MIAHDSGRAVVTCCRRRAGGQPLLPRDNRDSRKVLGVSARTSSCHACEEIVLQYAKLGRLLLRTDTARLRDGSLLEKEPL
jgi:hypothetical protein